MLFTNDTRRGVKQHKKRGTWKERGREMGNTSSGGAKWPCLRGSWTEGSGAQHTPGLITAAGTTRIYLWVSDQVVCQHHFGST